jgi:hypothetical protein
VDLFYQYHSCSYFVLTPEIVFAIWTTMPVRVQAGANITGAALSVIASLSVHNTHNIITSPSNSKVILEINKKSYFVLALFDRTREHLYNGKERAERLHQGGAPACRKHNKITVKLSSM